MKSINDIFDEPLFDAKAKNMLLIMPRPYTTLERIERILKNSAEFDKASYEADGGEAWIDPRRKEFFDRDKAKDKNLWDKAVKASLATQGGEDWRFIVWAYKKLGGKF